MGTARSIEAGAVARTQPLRGLRDDALGAGRRLNAGIGTGCDRSGHSPQTDLDRSIGALGWLPSQTPVEMPKGVMVLIVEFR